MADKHPYVVTNGALIQVFDHLKKSFPATFDADTLRKLGLAPHNESYIINTIRFLKLIDENGARTVEAQKTFTLHDSTSFAAAFSALVKESYDDLFKLHGDAAWGLANTKLITYFRQTDQSSELVGTRQAGTFRMLATYAGQSVPVPAPTGKPKPSSNGKPKAKAKSVVSQNEGFVPPAETSKKSGWGLGERNVGLTVRIEVNLPASGDQETYNNIFKSIRENLLNA